MKTLSLSFFVLAACNVTQATSEPDASTVIEDPIETWIDEQSVVEVDLDFDDSAEAVVLPVCSDVLLVSPIRYLNETHIVTIEHRREYTIQIACITPEHWINDDAPCDDIVECINFDSTL